MPKTRTVMSALYVSEQKQENYRRIIVILCGVAASYLAIDHDFLCEFIFAESYYIRLL